MADEMRTAQKLFEKPEENFDDPPLSVEQRNDLGGNVKQVGGDVQDAVAVDACRA